MARRFGWLDRGKKESVEAYDRRINGLEAFHAGYAFLTLPNYCEEYEAFSVYAVWNGEFNAHLSAALPDGGFMMHCGRDVAEEMCALGHAFPVFIRLYARLGQLYAEQLVLADRDRLYDLYFNGCEVVRPEGLVFYGWEEPERGLLMQRTDAQAPSAGGAVSSAAPLKGSYRMGGAGGSYRFAAGSYHAGSFRASGGSFISFGSASGSRVWGSYLSGSYRFGSFLETRFGAGSFRQGLSGSYLMRLFGGGSYFSAFGSSFASSYRMQAIASSRLAGSAFFGSGYWAGSYRSLFMNGSYYAGSYHRGSFLYGGFAGEKPSGAEPAAPQGTEPEGGMMLPQEYRLRRLTWELGYGLDLI
ncbi:MAG: hypothetical protein K6E50_10780 [Lachnospiraceae bacterium]|nr:hypothetical protein [Lachnospiraceae bacterium]